MLKLGWARIRQSPESSLLHSLETLTVRVFARESSYCFQRILAIVILSVRPSVTRVDQSKTMQARITKSSPTGAWKVLALGTIKFFQIRKSHPNEGAK